MLITTRTPCRCCGKPHRPSRPAKSEAASSKLVSDYEPAGDQPAIPELVAGVNERDTNQVLRRHWPGKINKAAKIIEEISAPALIPALNKTLAAQPPSDPRASSRRTRSSSSLYDGRHCFREAHVPRTDTYIEKDSFD